MSANTKTARTVATRLAAGACALALALGLSGCALSDAFALVGSLTTPSLDEVERDEVESTLSSTSLVEDGVLTVAVDTSNGPQAMTLSDGSIGGYDIDVVLALAQRLGLSVKIVSTTDAEDALTSSTADIYIGTETDDDVDDCTNTVAYLQNATAVFTDSSVNPVSEVTSTSLEEGVVAVQEASASQDALVRAGIAATTQTYSNVNECFEALASGEVDYVVCDATAGGYLARMYADIEFVGTITTVTTYSITVLSSNTELLDAVEEALEDIKADGALEAIHGIWYGDVPFSLSGTTLSGVTIESDDEEESSSDDDDDSITISGDINSLSS